MEDPIQALETFYSHWSQPPPYKVVATDKRCVCGKEIQPGQSYAPGRQPRHIICARES